MNFSSRGRPLIQAGPSKSQIAADELARMAANRMRIKLQEQAPDLLAQLQNNKLLQQQLLTAVQDPNDVADLVALLGEMNMGRGGKRRRTKRRRTLKRMTKRRRR